MHVVFVLGRNFISSLIYLSYLLVCEVVSWLSIAALEIRVINGRDRDFPESSELFPLMVSLRLSEVERHKNANISKL